MKKITSILLSVSMIVGLTCGVTANTDDFIFTDTVQKTYDGRTEASALINNINFTDLNASNKESVTRAGALNLVKGFENTYKPGAYVTNEEAIAFAMRVIGKENAAIARGNTIKANFPNTSNLKTLWSVGYLAEANDLGIITPAEYADSLVENTSTLDPAVSFVRNAPAKKEDVAMWLVKAVNTVDPAYFTPTESVQGIISYDDWKSADAENAPYIEEIVSKGVMTTNNRNFNPKGNVTRSEMATYLTNLDSIYYEMNGLEEKTGTVGGVRVNQAVTTGQKDYTKDYYVRNDDGKVDVLRLFLSGDTSPQTKNKDMVVYKNGKVAGLGSLKEGDQIEYIVSKSSPDVGYYVQVKNTTPVNGEVNGKLNKMNYTDGTITVIDSNGSFMSYKLANGLYWTENNENYLTVNKNKRKDSELPYGSMLTLKLKNDIVTEISYVGQPVIINEFRGIVVENNPDFGYITVIDNSGKERTIKFNENNMVVEKQKFYDSDDEIGYIDSVFPNFKYDPRDTTISQIEPGDIVFIRPDPANPEYIKEISASTNYVMKSGKIKSFNVNGNTAQMHIEYDNGATSWFTVPTEIFIMKDGKIILPAEVQAGDYAKILVNQAIISPGYMIESVKEIILEGNDKNITQLIKGQIGAIDPIQNTLTVQNAQILNNDKWANYSQIKTFKLGNKNTEIYYQGNRVDMDFMNRYLKRGDSDAYIALENNYSGETVKKINIDGGRSTQLGYDVIVSSNGSGNFVLNNSPQNITADKGTIIVRNGRLVEAQDIEDNDYATVALASANKASLVSITDYPGNYGYMIARGRVQSVDEGNSFKVYSMAILNGTKWDATPIQREFSMDYNTVYITENGPVSFEEFKGYTSTTAIDKVFNIITDGSRAEFIIDAPYAKESVKGTIYEVTDSSIQLKDFLYLDKGTNTWKPVSSKNNIGVVTIMPNSVGIKNNKVIDPKTFVVGDKIEVMTDALPANKTSGMTVKGYIITN